MPYDQNDILWFPIPGSDKYQASSEGQIRNGRTSRILKPAPNPDGYLTVSLSEDNVKKTKTVHSLVMLAFVGPPPKGFEVCHGENGKQDNSLKNLKYGTKSQNANDRKRDGTQYDVSKRVLRSDGVEFRSLTEAAEMSGTTPSNIASVCRGRRRAAGLHGWNYSETNNATGVRK